jgi:hypothetical protein
MKLPLPVVTVTSRKPTISVGSMSSVARAVVASTAAAFDSTIFGPLMSMPLPGTSEADSDLLTRIVFQVESHSGFVALDRIDVLDDAIGHNLNGAYARQCGVHAGGKGPQIGLEPPGSELGLDKGVEALEDCEAPVDRGGDTVRLGARIATDILTVSGFYVILVQVVEAHPEGKKNGGGQNGVQKAPVTGLAQPIAQASPRVPRSRRARSVGHSGSPPIQAVIVHTGRAGRRTQLFRSARTRPGAPIADMRSVRHLSL